MVATQTTATPTATPTVTPLAPYKPSVVPEIGICRHKMLSRCHLKKLLYKSKVKPSLFDTHSCPNTSVG
ncbi:hypothetical protein DPMN_001507 [Dreissena polymorpha]|uniref:Uncharacterized protein n=1 Tax=Dreissena polymorpha TaxID=45954 RepID=A0A9D4MLU4_DREPO|nr:hypothetical protein DPMN_001507 [Dreissena polymorpha]